MLGCAVDASLQLRGGAACRRAGDGCRCRGSTGFLATSEVFDPAASQAQHLRYHRAWVRMKRCAPFPRPQPYIQRPAHSRMAKLASFRFRQFSMVRKTAESMKPNALKVLPLEQGRWDGGGVAFWGCGVVRLRLERLCSKLRSLFVHCHMSHNHNFRARGGCDFGAAMSCSSGYVCGVFSGERYAPPRDVTT